MNLQDDFSRRASDLVAAGSVPVNVALWLADIDFAARLLVSLGSLILIGLAIAAKVRQWRNLQ